MNQQIIDILKTAGYPGRRAKVIAYLLSQQQPVSLWTIEIGSHQRQNVANPTVKELVEHGWVQATKSEPKKEAGRRSNLYQFSDRAAFLRYIETTIQEKAAANQSVVTDDARAIILGGDA